jgi:hypothetical protein
MLQTRERRFAWRDFAVRSGHVTVSFGTMGTLLALSVRDRCVLIGQEGASDGPIRDRSYPPGGPLRRLRLGEDALYVLRFGAMTLVQWCNCKGCSALVQ